MGCLVSTDLVASGSCDGQLRFWKCTPDGSLGGLHSVDSVELRGWVNGVRFGRSRGVVVAALGSEHRLGRWFTTCGGTNGIAVCSFTVDA